MSITAKLAAIRALHEAATPGPWGNHCGDVCQRVPHTDVPEAPWDFYPESRDVVCQGENDYGDEFGFRRASDMDLTIALRNAAPALLAIAEAAGLVRTQRGGPVRWPPTIDIPPEDDFIQVAVCRGHWDALQKALDAFERQP